MEIGGSTEAGGTQCDANQIIKNLFNNFFSQSLAKVNKKHSWC